MSVESDQELAADTVVNGRYKIVRVVAHGGMGAVYLAEDTQLRRKVALKLLSHEVTEDRELAQRFIHEAQNASRINHPSVVTIFDNGVESESGRQFLVTEFVDGITLKDYLSNQEANTLRSSQLIESDFKEKDLNSEGPVLLFVSHENSAPGPYQSIRSVLERIARSNPDTIKVLWLNTSDNFLLAYKLDSADSSPHLFLFKNGKKQRRLDGNASEDAIVGMLKGYVTVK